MCMYVYIYICMCVYGCVCMRIYIYMFFIYNVTCIHICLETISCETNDVCPPAKWSSRCVLLCTCRVYRFKFAYIHKHPAGPETVPIKRTFLKKMVIILPQCRADLMIGNPGKTWGALFGFSASSLQRMHRYQLAVSILVNASPLPSSSIHHQEVTFGTQVAGNWLFHQIPHRTCNVVSDPRDLSSVAACNVVSKRSQRSQQRSNM